MLASTVSQPFGDSARKALSKACLRIAAFADSRIMMRP